MITRTLAPRGSRFIDAPPWGRCGATTTLRDGSHAQCGRWKVESYASCNAAQGYCTQHAEMVLSGKKVQRWR